MAMSLRVASLQEQKVLKQLLQKPSKTIARLKTE